MRLPHSTKILKYSALYDSLTLLKLEIKAFFCIRQSLFIGKTIFVNQLLKHFQLSSAVINIFRDTFSLHSIFITIISPQIYDSILHNYIYMITFYVYDNDYAYRQC